MGSLLHSLLDTMADVEMTEAAATAEPEVQETAGEVVPGFSVCYIKLLCGLLFIAGIALIVVGGVVQFDPKEDTNQWIKLRVLENTPDGLLMTLENETAPEGMPAGGVLGKEWADRTKINVPYDTIFVSLGCACLSLAAMCYFAESTLNKAQGSPKMAELSGIIQVGAKNFMLEEAKYIVAFAIVMTIVIGLVKNSAPFAINYVIGALLSYTAGNIGMAMATRTNARTASACWQAGLPAGLQVAFRGGAVMGQAVVGLGILGIAISYLITGNVKSLAGYGAGASTIALFARVAGGIYTKAADVGADLVGKVVNDIPEDDVRNPATIADNVGDNVGDIAGMGADLFESFVGGIIAAMVLGSQVFGTVGAALPLWCACIGIFGGIIGDMYISAPKDANLGQLLFSMHRNIYGSALIIVIGIFVASFVLMTDTKENVYTYTLADGYKLKTAEGIEQWSVATRLFLSVLVGLTAGELISLVTEYFTSHDYSPTRSIAMAGRFAAGTVIIAGIGQGMLSTVVPLSLVTITIIWSYTMLGGFAVSMAAVGMLSTLGVTMACDAYGPIADNAGGIAEMVDDIGTAGKETREKTDKLDAMGNTTAATGKGFSNASAVLTALSTLTAFMDEAGLEQVSLTGNIFVIAGLLVGAVLPYIFVAQTMLAVGRAAQAMIANVCEQYSGEWKDAPAEHKGMSNEDALMKRLKAPDHESCIKISTSASIREMIIPGAMAVFAPLPIGFLFGSLGLCGMLLGSIASGYLMGVMTSNAGGAWDNAKKYVEAGLILGPDGKPSEKHKKGTDTHKNVVAGDTVGDPFKDTSGPALNCLIKLMTLFAFVFATAFPRSVTASDYSPKFIVGLIIIGVGILLVVFVSCCSGKREDLISQIEMVEWKEQQAANGKYVNVDV